MRRGEEMSVMGTNMDFAPGRKHEYMQSKWLGTSEKITQGLLFPVVAVAATAVGLDRSLRLRASMLTSDLSFPVVEVV